MNLVSLSNFVIPTKTFGNIPFTLTDPSSNSNGSFSYVSSNTNVATISSVNVVTIIGPGTSIITATQSATSNYTSGDISANLIVSNSTLDNPTNINNNTELLYFLNTSAVYGNIQNSIETEKYVTSLSKKIFINNSNQHIKLIKQNN